MDWRGSVSNDRSHAPPSARPAWISAFPELSVRTYVERDGKSKDSARSLSGRRPLDQREAYPRGIAARRVVTGPRARSLPSGHRGGGEVALRIALAAQVEVITPGGHTGWYVIHYEYVR